MDAARRLLDKQDKHCESVITQQEAAMKAPSFVAMLGICVVAVSAFASSTVRQPTHASGSAAASPAAVALKQDMRKLWTDHVGLERIRCRSDPFIDRWREIHDAETICSRRARTCSADRRIRAEAGPRVRRADAAGDGSRGDRQRAANARRRTSSLPLRNVR